MRAERFVLDGSVASARGFNRQLRLTSATINQTLNTNKNTLHLVEAQGVFNDDERLCICDILRHYCGARRSINFDNCVIAAAVNAQNSAFVSSNSVALTWPRDSRESWRKSDGPANKSESNVD
jgi:hypothetical protein